MLMVARAAAILFIVTMIAGWLVGIVSYLRIFREARRRGHGFWGLYWFGAYRFAFGEMRGSPQTRRMLLGFGVMVGSLLLVAAAGAVIESLAR
jgi:hypothetical protein